MLAGLLLLLAPAVVFVVSLPYSRRLNRGISMVYRYLGGFVVFAGSGASLYFASFSGDQGGIAATFFQIAVIVLYVALSIVLLTLNWVLGMRESGRSER